MSTSRRHRSACITSVAAVLSLVLSLLALVAGVASPAAAAGLPPSYAPPLSIPTGSEPSTTAMVDADLDGDLDLIVVNVQSSSVSIIENLGGGSFGSPVNLPAGAFPSDVVAADMDNDGLVDLVITNREPPRQVSILYGDGLGSFSAPVAVGTGGRPHFVDVSDLNGDGLRDIVVTHCCNSGTLNYYVSVILATTTTTYAGPVNYSTAAGMATRVRIADLDGDGDDDIVTALRDFSYISLWANDGTGVFTPSYVSIPNYAMEIADLNGDGRKDLVVTNFGSTTVNVLFNTSTASSISFGTPIPLTASGATLNGFAGDMNGDGVEDAVLTHQALGAVSIVLGSTSGAPMIAGPFTTAPSPNRGTAGDLNGDGKLDIAVTSQVAAGSAVILLNNAVAPPCGFGPTFVVNETIDDDGTATPTLCSVREAILAADAYGGPATVEVPAGTYVRTLAGSGPLGDLNITGDVTVVGAGAATTILDANGIQGHFFIPAGGRLVLSGVTLTGGNSSGGGGMDVGGTAILNEVVIDGNHGINGGAINVGGSASHLEVHRSTLSNNTATFEGGAINHSSAGPVLISNTTITGNVAGGAGGVLATRVTSNTYIENSTMVGNFAHNKGGITPLNGSVVYMRNSVLAANDSDVGSKDCDLFLQSLGYNVIGHCSAAAAPGDVFLGIVPVASLVGALADNGGPTPTMLPVSGGALIDAGNPATPGTGGLTCVDVDQRGVSRLTDVCDAGAVEAGTLADTTPPVVVVVSPADNAVFELGSTVVADFWCTDADLVSCVGTVADGDAVGTSATGAFSFTVTGTDASGNATSVTHTYTVVDTTGPEVVIVSPADGAVFELGSRVVADFWCSDLVLSTCLGSVPVGDPIDTSATGTFSFTVTGADASGNVTSVTHTFTVV
ncbi:MAG: VCBS repeat-containing protein, partial [Acidimicrobiales bacterium]|nr:VCBS repeat-containing protein [Acidimicrobiales bacterium]